MPEEKKSLEEWEGARRRGAKGSWGSPLHLLECHHLHSSGYIRAGALQMLPIQQHVHILAAAVRNSYLWALSPLPQHDPTLAWKASRQPLKNGLFREILLWRRHCIVERRHSAHRGEREPPDNMTLFLIYADSMNACIIDASTAASYYWYARRIKLC